MLKPENLLEKNLESLKTNNYTIDECIELANQQFNDLIVPVSKTSRGYKVALKKLADEVLSLRKQIKDDQSCKTKQEKAFFTDASSQDSLALV
jgi:hypothetical protein